MKIRNSSSRTSTAHASAGSLAANVNKPKSSDTFNYGDLILGLHFLFLVWQLLCLRSCWFSTAQGSTSESIRNDRAGINRTGGVCCKSKTLTIPLLHRPRQHDDQISTSDLPNLTIFLAPCRTNDPSPHAQPSCHYAYPPFLSPQPPFLFQSPCLSIQVSATHHLHPNPLYSPVRPLPTPFCWVQSIPPIL